MATPTSLAAVGDYRLLRALASGGMATVHIGERFKQSGFKRLCAIKICHAHLAENADFVAMFLDEARLAAGIRHPNVVGTIDVSDGNVADGSPLYLVMDYIEGSSLGGLLKAAQRKGAPLAVPIVLRVLIDLLSGLHAAHEHRGPDGAPLGIVHRDVSPQNVLIGVDGISRITDFGIAFSKARSVFTEVGHVKGKCSYIAPEALASAPVERGMDVFSAAVVLWEALTGTALFRRESTSETLTAILNEEPPRPSSKNPLVSAELDHIVLRALAKRPSDRFATAAEFRDALLAARERIADHAAVGELISNWFGEELEKLRSELRDAPGTPLEFTPPAALPVAVKPSLPPEIEHWRHRVLVVGFLLLLVGGALGVLIPRNHPPEPAVHIK